MSRSPDPDRKPALLAQILDHLQNQPLSAVTFRTLATALGVSTFTLVYHFGTHAQLLSEIITAISARQTTLEKRIQRSTDALDTYYDNLVLSWEWTITPRNRELQRLEFEGSMLEALDRESPSVTRDLFATWLKFGSEALRSCGLSPEDADIEARIMVDAFYGLQYDLVVNRDEVGVTAAFHRLIAQHRERVVALVGQQTA